MPNSDHICTQVHGVYICTVSQLKLSGKSSYLFTRNNHKKGPSATVLAKGRYFVLASQTKMTAVCNCIIVIFFFMVFVDFIGQPVSDYIITLLCIKVRLKFH